jgi:hypothetical protein
LSVETHNVLAEGRAAAAIPLTAELRKHSRIIGGLRELAGDAAALPADRQEAETLAENLSQRVLEKVRGEYATHANGRAVSGRR